MKRACAVDDKDLQGRGWKAIECFGGKTCLIVKDELGLRGFMNVCPHTGGPSIPVDNEAGERVLQCQNHGAEFDIISGKTLKGPAPEGSSLRTIELKVEDGIIYYS